MGGDWFFLFFFLVPLVDKITLAAKLGAAVWCPPPLREGGSRSQRGRVTQPLPFPTPPIAQLPWELLRQRADPSKVGLPASIR